MPRHSGLNLVSCPGLKNLLMGSVTEQVIARAEWAVLVARA